MIKARNIKNRETHVDARITQYKYLVTIVIMKNTRVGCKGKVRECMPVCVRW